MSTGSSSQTTYDYDELGRLKTVTLTKRNGVDLTLTSDEEITSYTYNLLGSRASVTYPNAVTTSYTYDDLNRLTELHTRNSSSATLAKFTYTLNDAGLRTRVVEEDNASNTTTIDYTYDVLNRLTQETHDAPGTGSDFSIAYVYDLVGNRKSKTRTGAGAATVNYTYNSSDQLTSDGSTTYSYDDNGSMTTSTTGGTTVTLDYSPDNRLNKQSVTGSSTTYHYLYNDAGIRVQTETQVSGSPTGAVNHLIDPSGGFTGYAQVLEERDASLNTTMTYTLGDDVLTQGDNAGTPNVYHLMYDGHGSTRLLVDPTETIAATYAYDAYGNAEGFTVSSAATRHLYAGEQHDAGSGWYYLRARWYDTGTGRFNRMDPYAGNMQDPISLHRYLYAHANPIVYRDPTGRFTIPARLASIAILSTVSGIIGGAINAARKRSVTAFFTGYASAYVGTFIQLSLLMAPVPGAAHVSGFVGGFVNGIMIETLDSWAEGKQWNRVELWTNVVAATVTGGIFGYFGAHSGHHLVKGLEKQIVELQRIFATRGFVAISGETVAERLMDAVATAMTNPRNLIDGISELVQVTWNTIGRSLASQLRSEGVGAAAGLGASSAAITMIALIDGVPRWIDGLDKAINKFYGAP